MLSLDVLLYTLILFPPMSAGVWSLSSSVQRRLKLFF